MEFKYAKTRENLPKDSDFQCPICYENIDIDEVKNGQCNCVICINGHRTHNTCYNQSNAPECPVCRSQTMKFCKSYLGYGYVERKGGKKRKTHKRRKINKKRKTYKRGKSLK